MLRRIDHEGLRALARMDDVALLALVDEHRDSGAPCTERSSTSNDYHKGDESRGGAQEPKASARPKGHGCAARAARSVRSTSMATAGRHGPSETSTSNECDYHDDCDHESGGAQEPEASAQTTEGLWRCGVPRVASPPARAYHV